jgi:hypothetical protein
MIGFGFSARHWQQIESGRPITLATLIRACRAFDTQPSAVLLATEKTMKVRSGAKVSGEGTKKTGTQLRKGRVR